MENISFTDIHKKTLNAKITKAINAIPNEEIQEMIMDYIEREIDNLYSDTSNFQDIVESQIREVVRDMFIEKGLLKV